MRPPLVLVPQHFGCLVFDRRTSRYLPFDHEATSLLLDLHANSIDATLARIGERDERDAVVRFIDCFDERRFFTLAGRLDADVLAVPDVPADHLVGPLAVHLEVIAACNLSCTHCFAGELPRNQHPLSVREMQTLFGDLARLGSFRLGLTGGEPLLRKDLFDVLDAATDAGLHPCLTTNALLLTEEIARELGKRPLVWLNVSLEGPTAEVNDAVRGAGTFDAVIDRLAQLRRHARFTLAFTVLRTNAHLVRQCAELASNVGAHTAVFRPLYPAGVALDHPELMPSFPQYVQALDDLASMHEDVREIDPFGPRTRAATQPVIHTADTCGAGQHVCSISVQGGVNPCSFLGPGFDTGNVRQTPFAVIWRTGHAMRRMRESSGDFRGGCRARALRLAGSVDAADPWLTEHEGGGCAHPSANVELVGSRLTPLPLLGGAWTMLPERLSWITEAFEPEGDPYVLLQIARDLEADGNLEGAATVFDRAYALAPEIDKIRQARQDVLDLLAIDEHGLTFRYVPAGPFLMGCREGEPDEQPLHPVWLSAYWLSETPVSWEDYCRLLGWRAPPMGRPADAAPDDTFLLNESSKIRLQYCGAPRNPAASEGSVRPRYRGGDPAEWRYDLKPMVSVGWQEAEELCAATSGYSVRFSLPTEAQWEKAARGGLIGAHYAWGDEPPPTETCDFNNFHGFEIRPCKELPPNGYGLYAMNGCVWEWTADWYDSEYYRHSPAHDPLGPETGQEKVLRGGSWSDCVETVTNTFRTSLTSKHWRNWRNQPGGWGGHVTPNVGFRLCRTVTPIASKK